MPSFSSKVYLVLGTFAVIYCLIALKSKGPELEEDGRAAQLLQQQQQQQRQQRASKRREAKPNEKRHIFLDCGANVASTVELFRTTYPGQSHASPCDDDDYEDVRENYDFL